MYPRVASTTPITAADAGALPASSNSWYIAQDRTAVPSSAMTKSDSSPLLPPSPNALVELVLPSPDEPSELLESPELSLELPVEAASPAPLAAADAAALAARAFPPRPAPRPRPPRPPRGRPPRPPRPRPPSANPASSLSSSLPDELASRATLRGRALRVLPDLLFRLCSLGMSAAW